MEEDTRPDIFEGEPVPDGVMSKGEMFDSIPLFLSKEYELIYTKSYERHKRSATVLLSPSNKMALDSQGKKAKGAAKMYKNKWL